MNSCKTYPNTTSTSRKVDQVLTQEAGLPGSPESLRPVHSSGVRATPSQLCFDGASRGFAVGSQWKLIWDIYRIPSGNLT